LKKLSNFLTVLFGRKIVLVAAVVVGFFLLCAVASPLIAPYDPNAIDLTSMLEGPSAEHIFGTDQHGRDLFSRIVYGSRMAFLVGVLAVLVATVIGVFIGLVAGYFGGAVDSVLMRIIEAEMSIPGIMLALALVATFGNSTGMLIFILGFSAIPPYARMMRAQVLSVRELDYVASSRIIGNSDLKTMLRHVFPNCLSPIIVLMSQSIGATILSEASLSYLGAGIMPPTASWGKMVSEGYQYLTTSPLFALLPGVAVILLVLSFNILGDGLRDALDPRMRGNL
jgi:peptide/nickel transport system permease protein